MSALEGAWCGLLSFAVDTVGDCGRCCCCCCIFAGSSSGLVTDEALPPKEGSPPPPPRCGCDAEKMCGMPPLFMEVAGISSMSTDSQNKDC